MEGDESAVALDVNNEGVVVGYGDDPYGPIGGPQAFVWKKGELTPLQLPIPTLYSSATSVTDSGMIGGFLQTLPRDENGTSKSLSFVLSPPRDIP